jgi:hypothetical protein
MFTTHPAVLNRDKKRAPSGVAECRSGQRDTPNRL